MMPPKKTTVYLNSFCLKTLDDGDKTVRVYGCIFKRSLSESDIVPQLNRIIYKLWMPAVGYHQRIIAFDAIAEGKLNTEDYQLTPEGTQELDPNNESDRQ